MRQGIALTALAALGLSKSVVRAKGPDTSKASAAVYLRQPGIGQIPGARELGEFGDDPHRYASAEAR